MTDTHFHPQLLGVDFPTCLVLAEQHQVQKMLMVGLKTQDSALLQSYAVQHPQLFFSVGVHPLQEESRHNLDSLEPYLLDRKCVAVGETGLDYYRSTNSEAQKILFRKQLHLAAKYHKPVIIHSREAESDTLAIIEEFPGVKGVLHSFTGSIEMALKAISLGYYISFSGIITFKNAAEVRRVATLIPSKHLLVETDSPYLSPQHRFSRRSEVNLPHKVAYVLEHLASIRNLSVEELESITDANAQTLFGF